MHYQEQETPEVFCKPGVYIAKLKSPKINIKIDFRIFLEGILDVDAMVNKGEKRNLWAIKVIVLI